MPAEEEGTMENQRFSTKVELVFGAISLFVLLVVSGFLANAVKENSARQASATAAQNKMSMTILTIKADIAESMLPPHDYLIIPATVEKDEFLELNQQIDMDFNILQINQHFEPIDHKVIDAAYNQFKNLQKTETEIFALRGGDIAAQGPQKMKTMHVYQGAILSKLGALNDLELAELEALVLKEQDANRSSVSLIAAAVALALGCAVLIGYLGNRR